MNRTGRFDLKKVMSKIEQWEQAHASAINPVDLEAETRQFMYRQLCDRLSRTIDDGREYLIKMSFVWDTKGKDVELTLTADVNLVHFVAANIGESIADLPSKVSSNIKEWQMSGTTWARKPWGWERTA